MNLAKATVRRPVFTTMVTLMVLVLGTMALSRLQVDLLPPIELPTLTVRTQYEGADPLVMERLVTQIIEEIVATVPGVVSIVSESYEGNSRVRVSFGWGSDIDAAALDVQATLEDERNELPDEISGPRVSKFDVDSFPVVILGVSSTLDPVEMTDLIQGQVRYRFARVPGVAQVDLWGEYVREVKVDLDPGRLSALKVSLNEITSALKDANLDLPAGRIEEGRHEVTLRAPAAFSDLEQIRQTVIRNEGGERITLAEVATVSDSYQSLSRLIRVNGERGVRIAIRKQPEANTVEVAAAVLAEMAEINRSLPQLEVAALTNQGNYIERSISNVGQSLLYGGLLSTLVLFLFLRDLRSTLVIALAIPISLIATFGLLYFAGLTINLMSLGGLALGVGLMVDSSVVVLENIFRCQREQQQTPHQAAVAGSGEVASAVVAGTLTTVVIFLPVIFIEGVTGVLFRELAYVIIFSLFCALIVALGLVPMIASRFLTHCAEGEVSSSLSGLQRLGDRYQQLLRLTLRRPLLTLTATVALLGAIVFVTPLPGTEFIPGADEGEVRVSGEMEEGTRLEIIDRLSLQLEQRVAALVPEAVASVVSVTASGTRGNAKPKVEVRLTLSPLQQRSRSNSDIAADLRQELEGAFPGMKIRTRAPQGQFLLQRLLNSDDGLKVEVRGYDREILNLLAQSVIEEMAQVEGVTDVESTREEGVPQQELVMLREQIADLGLRVKDLSEAIKVAVAGSNAGEYRVEGDSYRIRVQLADADRRSLEEILDLTLQTPQGEQVALRHLVQSQRGIGATTIERKEQQRVVTVSGNLSGRDSGAVAAELRQRLETISRPVGYELILSGNIEAQQEAFAELIQVFILALMLVYMVLASQYESLRDPLVVMLTVPMAGVGVLLTLEVTATTLNLQSAIGCIMLAGIVVNNAILLVDQAGQLRRGGLSVADAAVEAGRRRLRPVLMTSFTTILALFPLALGMGEGAETQAPMARVVVGGLTSAALITLILIPLVYTLFHWRRDTPQSPPSI
ncbi:MAG: efflux RND transporter permease subunit [Gammaproteobacteria bacterium]|nr:efflux RND transporter permease subunit [Gammaproteobacteria bacterium]